MKIRCYSYLLLFLSLIAGLGRPIQAADDLAEEERASIEAQFTPLSSADCKKSLPDATREALSEAGAEKPSQADRKSDEADPKVAPTAVEDADSKSIESKEEKVVVSQPAASPLRALQERSASPEAVRPTKHLREEGEPSLFLLMQSAGLAEGCRASSGEEARAAVTPRPSSDEALMYLTPAAAEDAGSKSIESKDEKVAASQPAASSQRASQKRSASPDAQYPRAAGEAKRTPDRKKTRRAAPPSSAPERRQKPSRISKTPLISKASLTRQIFRDPCEGWKLDKDTGRYSKGDVIIFPELRGGWRYRIKGKSGLSPIYSTPKDAAKAAFR